ncbi:MAG: DNA gyrase subunit B, partial [Myxococcota bacterium]|nr:DNA gyrase subunit B [Myxococcota bacterium]
KISQEESAVLVRVLLDGEEKEFELRALSESREAFSTLIEQLSDEISLPAKVNGKPVYGWSQLFESTLESARKGCDIQRYKGLGEMNPEQLWETTMDPTRRSLMQVKVDEENSADGIFSILMGDVVSLRRDFIQQNALDVKNLDI